MDKLSSRAVMGMYFLALEQVLGIAWLNQITNAPFPSDMETEEYAWLGQVPGLREWIGGRLAKGLTDQSYRIRNREYESTIEFLVKEMRRDKTGQINIRILEHVERAQAHWAKLVSELLIAGEAQLCYDGQYFFDTDHTEGDSGSQNNDLTTAIVLKTAPTAAEMATAIFGTIQAMMGFKDDTGEPMNATAREFLVMVPTPFMQAAAAALSDTIIVDGSTSRTNTLTNTDKFKVSFDVNPYLGWTDKFVVFRTDSRVPPIIRQEEVPIEVSAIAEGSELEFREKKHQYGLYTSRAAGYGFWQFACLHTFTTTGG
jgi:phage major head subunit gpT-like protein